MSAITQTEAQRMLGAELAQAFVDFQESPTGHTIAALFQAADTYLEDVGERAPWRAYLAYEANSPTNAAKHLTRRAREVLNEVPYRGALQMICDGLTEALALAETDGRP